MKKLTLLLCLISASFSYAQDSISVLFIGNSYVYVNDLPTVFSNLTTSLGDIATVDSKASGGFTFQNQLNDPATHTKIHARPWDFVVLQGQSQEPSFPTSQVNSSTLPPAVALADSVYANNYCSQAMYFMTWGRQVGDPQWDSINTFDKMNGRLRDAYVRISDSAQGCVAPVGVAWKYVRDNFPTINLYQADGSHPSVEGTYLAACTFYASSFRKPSTGATYTAGLDATTALKLQTAADLAVLDSLTTWHLRPKEEIAIADFHVIQNGTSLQVVNDSWRATDYSWDFGDLSTSSFVNGTHNYSNPGTYSVQLIASNECGSDTLVITVQIEASGLSELSQEQLLVKQLGEGRYELQAKNQAFTSDIQLVGIDGRSLKLDVTFVNEHTVEIDLSKYPNGTYFLQFSCDNQLYSQKIMR